MILKNELTSNNQKEFFFQYIFIFSALMLLTIFVAEYPIFFGDSQRYIKGALHLKGNQASPMAYYFLISPIARIGPWAWVTMQTIITSIVLVEFAGEIKNRVIKMTSIIVAILLSQLWYLSARIMPDIYTALGMMCIYIIYTNRRNPRYIISVILFLCTLPHHGNFYIFLMVTIPLLLIKKFSPYFILNILLPILLSFLCLNINWQEADHSGNNNIGKSFLSARLMRDFPKETIDYINKHPNSLLVEYQDDIKLIIEKTKYTNYKKKKIANMYLWGNGPLKKIGHKKFNDAEGSQFILCIITESPVKFISKSLFNAFDLLFQEPGTSGFIRNFSDKGKILLVNLTKKYWSDSVESMNIHFKDFTKIESKVYYNLSFLAYLFSLIYCLFFAIIHTKIDHNNWKKIMSFTLYGLFCNSFIMNNLAGISTRYHTRLFVIPILVMCMHALFFSTRSFKVLKTKRYQTKE